MNTGKSNIRIIIAGGGTGGHIFPAVAIANAVRTLVPGSEILFVGAKGKMEMEKVPKEGYRIVGLDIAGFNRSALWKNVLLPFKLFRSFMHASGIVKEFKPDVVVGVGGYASFPLLYMAQRKGIPSIIQEQNSFAGKSNRILGKRARLICVAYKGMEKFFPAEKILLTGNPVRRNIQNKVAKNEACAFFSLNESKPTVFAFGGSLGARSINQALAAGFTRLSDAGIQLIWQTGTAFFKQAQEAVKGYEHLVQVREFIREMDMAYAAADVIVSRAGASSISELCIVGRPVIFIPFPFASEDHQTHNAMALVQQEAAWMIKDADAGTELIEKIIELIKNDTVCRRMTQQLSGLAVTDADTRIAEHLIALAS